MKNGESPTLPKFKKVGEFCTNKDLQWLEESTLIIYWQTEPFLKNKTNFVVVGGKQQDSKVDIPKSSDKLPLLLARLAAVFEIYDQDLDRFEECEFYRDELNNIRIKTQMQNHETTLEETAGVLYLIDKCPKVSVIIGEKVSEKELKELMKFLFSVGLLKDKIGIFSKKPLSHLATLSIFEE